MGRPSKLPERLWAEIESRHLKGESISKLAKEFKIGVQTVRDRVSVKNSEIKDVAKQLVEAEQRFSSLPVSVQVSVRTLADELKAISTHLAGAARFGAMTAHRLSGIAHTESNKIDDTSPLTDMETLKGISALTRMANESAGIGLNLIKANQDAVDRLNDIEAVPAITQITRRIVKQVN